MRFALKPYVLCLGLSLLFSAPLDGQSLRRTFENLFRFGDCGNDALLCLKNTSGQDAALTFSDAVEGGNNLLIGFVTDAIGRSISNIPTPATSTGSIIEFTPGGRIQTRRLSAGPIYAERAPTLGKKKLLVGVLLTAMRFQALRGVPLSNLAFNFRHVDIPGTPGFGNPVQENNILQVTMDVELQTWVSSFFVTYGVLNNLDLGIAIPVVRTSLSGRSEAQILPFGSNSVYSFGGPAADPQLTETSYQQGSAIGFGDIGIRAKLNIRQSSDLGFALRSDIRLPTGSEEELLGLGTFAVNALGVASWEFGIFTPHLNLGYRYRAFADSLQNHGLLAALGFDLLLAGGVTFAADLLSDIELDKSSISIPQNIEYTEPYTRVVPATTIPDGNDSRTDASIGVKWAIPCSESWSTFCATGANQGTGMTIITALLVPLDNGGLRTGLILSLGAQYRF